jgi:sulfhydrogenase subunit delta
MAKKKTGQTRLTDKNIVKPVKPKVGFYAVTGCQGCLLSVLFNEDEILAISDAIDIVAFPFIKGDNPEVALDICFIEGTVVSKDDKEVVERLRARSKVVIALGTCACEGNIPAIKTFVEEKKIDYLKYKKRTQNQDVEEPIPLHELITVEYRLPGCPPDRDEIKEFIKEILLGKQFYNYKDPVCIECELNGNDCLLEHNTICLGSITRGGCKAVCPTNGLKCYGCRGLTDKPNFDEFFSLMKAKGFRIKDVKKIMDTFMAREVHERLKDTKWQKYH